MRIAGRLLLATALTSTALTQVTAVAGAAATASAADGAAPSGSLPLATFTFNNFGTVSGDLTPGVSTIVVAGVPELIDDVEVSLHGVSSFNSLKDVKVSMVAPNGSRVDLIDDACQGETAALTDISFAVDDQAPSPLPETDPSTACTQGGSIQPSNYFQATPAEPTTLSALNDGPANGQWQLFVSTKNNVDVALLRGWSLTITSTDTTLTPTIASVSPSSPGQSTVPVFRGTAEDMSTVLLYTDAACTNFMNLGSAADFSGPNGIPVTVPANSTTTIHALALAPGKRASACSAPITYVNDQAPPEAPTGLTLSPASPGRTTTPVIKGSAEAGSTVGLFTNNCSGVPVASGQAVDFTTNGLRVSAVLPGSTTAFRAMATDAAGNESPCSSAVDYVNDVSDPAAPSGLTVSPVSPDASNAPVIKGSAETGSMVKLYTSGDCSGASVATATAAVFDSTGLVVAVAAGSTTTFRATATDAAGNTSPCSTSSVTYVNNAVVPVPPTDLAVAPLSPGSTTAPVIKGSADSGLTVNLYTSGDCTGFPVATGSGAVFGSTGLTVTVAAGSTTTFRATAADAAGNTSACSTSSVTYSHRPNTRLDRTPKRKVRTASRSTRVAFRFSSPTPGATFQCKMDGGTFGSCTSGEKFKVRLGRHHFAVRAKIAGHVDPTPATYSFRVIRS